MIVTCLSLIQPSSVQEKGMTMKVNGYKAYEWLGRMITPQPGDTPQLDAERRRSCEAILNALRNVSIEVPETECNYLIALKEEYQRRAGPELSDAYDFE